MLRIHSVLAPVQDGARLHLYPLQETATINQKIVRSGITMWPGDDKAVTRSAEGEAEFGELALALAL